MSILLRIKDPLRAWGYQPLTFPAHAARLRGLAVSLAVHGRGGSGGGGDEVVAIAAEEEGRAIGLCLAQPAAETAELLSLFVAPDARGRGLGTALLERAEAELAALGARRLRAVYSTGLPAAAAVERVLSRRGFTGPAPRMLLCSAGAQVLAAPWLRMAALPPGCQLFPWPALQPAEREALLRGKDEGAYPADLCPLDFERGMDAARSLGARMDGRVVAWLLTHARDAHTLRFTCCYVLRDLPAGALVPIFAKLLEQVILAMQEAGMTRATFTVPESHAPMARFVRAHLAPFLSDLAESRESHKTLEPAA